jgi:hypothetical protein
MDVEDIPAGERFAKVLDKSLAGCEAVLVVIGPRWAEILQERAQQQHTDYVRHEVEAALARQIRVVPVLVGGATMAHLAGLPDSLSALTQHEAAELRNNSFSDDCARLAKELRLEPVRPSRRKLWIALLAAAAVIGLLFAVGIGPWREYRARKASIDQTLATARLQSGRAEHESAFRTYHGLLKLDPGNQAATEARIDAAMAWLRDFRVVPAQGTKPEARAGALLDEISPVLDAGLAQTNGQGPRAATILAHIGWWHWLNQHLAYREFETAPRRDLTEALRLDASNVYAHAMLGSWMMLTNRGTKEALTHFQAAVDTKAERPFVRKLQLGALIYPRDSETRIALVRAADDMRRNAEPLEDRYRSRILNVYSPTVNSGEELAETLSAVPPADAWATFLWLDEPPADASPVLRPFIRSHLLEIEGKRPEALSEFEQLRGELKRRGYDGRIATHVEDAIKRLSNR